MISSNVFGIEDARTSIEIVHAILNQHPTGLVGEYHPLAKLKQSIRPF
jgi:UDP-N-acetyl-2-amino-2-deoxyglucuronate dehydrogenase